GHGHGFLGRATDADAQHAGRAPAGTHGRHRLEHPVHQRVTGVEHDELRLVLGAAALRRDLDIHATALPKLYIDDTGGVIPRVLAGEQGVGKHRRPQRIVRVQITAAHALIAEFLHAQTGVDTDVHPDLEEDVDNAGVLPDGTLALRAHAGVGQDLGNGILRRGVLLTLVGARQMLNVV